MALPKLVVELAAKIREYMADLDKAATATEASAARIEQADKTIADAAKDAATGQASMADTAVQVATRMGPVGGVVAAAAAVVAGYGLASYKAAQENTALVKALALSGQQAGVTAGQLQGVAAAASNVVGTHGQAAEAIGLMVSGGKVAGENLQALTVTALNASRTLGIGVQETVKHYEALADSPAKASAKLNESMGYLNAETYRRIQALEEMGRKDEAAALAQQTYARGVDDAAKKVDASLGYVQRGWRAAGEAAGWAWDKFLGLGRKDEVQDSLAGLRQKLDEKERQLRAGFATTGGGAAVGMRGMSDDRRGQLEAEAEGLREQIRLMGRAGATAAANAAASARYQKEGIEWADKAAAAEERLKSNATKRAEAIAKADEALRMGYIKQEERNNLVADAEKRYADKATKGAKAASDDFARMRAEIQKQLDLANEQLVVGRQLTASEKFRIDTLSKIDEALRKQNITQAQAIQLQKDMAVAAAARDAVDDKARRIKIDQALFAQQVQNMEDEAAYNVARSKAWEQSQLALSAYNQSVMDQIDLTQVELGLAGQTQQNRDLALTYYRIELELKKQIRAIDESTGYDNEVDREVARARARATAAKARLNAETQSQVTEWNRVFDQVENGLTDALMRGFEAGKSMFDNLRDYTFNLFKTLVLRPIIQATVQGGMQSLGFGGAPSAGGGAGFSGFGSGGYGSLMNNGFGASFGLSENMYAGFPGMGTNYQLTELGTDVASLADSAVSFLGYANALNTAFSRNAQGGKDYGAAAGQALGMYLGGPIGSMIGGSIGKALGIVDYGGTYHTGGIGSYSAAGGIKTGAAALAGGMSFGLDAKDYDPAGEKAAAGFARGIVGVLDGAATMFGKKAGYEVSTAFADDISPSGAWGALFIRLGDKTITDWKDGKDQWPGREFADGDAGLKEFQAAAAKDVRDYLITEAPAWADTMLNALGDAPTIEQLAGTVAQIGAAQAAFEDMGRLSAQFAAMGEDSMSTLVAAMGGAQAAAQGLSTYVGLFYSESERAALGQAKLTDALALHGLAMPASEAEYRKLVEAQDLNTESGRTLYAELIRLAPAFASSAAAADKYMGLLDANAKKYLNPDQYKAYTYERASTQLKGLGFDFSADILSATDTASIKAWIVELARTGAVSSDTLASLIALADGLIDVKGSADSAGASVANASSGGGGSYVLGTSSSGGVENPDITWLRDSLQSIAQETRDALQQIADGLVDSTRNAYEEVDYQARLKAEASGLDGKRSQISGLTGTIESEKARAAAISAAMGSPEQMRAYLESQGWVLGADATDEQLAQIMQSLAYNANSGVFGMQQLLDQLTTDFAGLDDSIKAWALAQKRLTAVKEMQTLKGEIDSAYEQISSLNSNSDPYADLATKLAKKYADYESGLGSELTAQIATLQGQADPYTAALADGIVSAEEAATLGLSTGGAGIGGTTDYTAAAIQALALLNGEIGTLTGESEDMLRMIAEWGDAQEALLNAQRRKEIQALLDGDIKQLYGSVDSTAGMQTRAAQQYIDSTLASLKNGGQLPDPTKLREAVDALKTGLGNATYNSQFEEDRARLILAGQLGQIKQLTVEEETLDIAYHQLDALAAINGGIEALVAAATRPSAVPVIAPAMTPVVANFAPVQSLMQDSQRRDETLVSEIRALRAENKAQAESLAALNLRLVKLHERWDGRGLPETRAAV